ncbi:MAG: hypothetical protein BYD32DRAFT_37191 [Podila humilis]|nr:MAG: hypothetical protein BYD32DRAFT_37191 [Podila humilis]
MDETIVHLHLDKKAKQKGHVHIERLLGGQTFKGQAKRGHATLFPSFSSRHAFFLFYFPSLFFDFLGVCHFSFSLSHFALHSLFTHVIASAVFALRFYSSQQAQALGHSTLLQQPPPSHFHIHSYILTMGCCGSKQSDHDQRTRLGDVISGLLSCQTSQPALFSFLFYPATFLLDLC